MGSPISPAALDDLRLFLQLGLSLVSTTRDKGMMPEITRCGGARLGEDGILRVLFAMPESTRSLANIDATGAIALSVVRPTTYRTLQVKGHDARRIDWPEAESIALSHRQAFMGEVEVLGLPKSITGFLWSKSFVAVGFTPTDIFDQTPGPGAGLSFIA
jgi:hypothetical protein